MKDIFDFENEKPLERLVSGGGYTGIFRTIGCIGDSLASGEFESTGEDGKKGYHDMYEYSWGQYIARTAGCKVYNFSRGGMTASEFNASFEKVCGIWSTEKKCQAYIIALGVNDLYGRNDEIGELGDFEKENKQNTFAAEYEKIIRKIKEFQPKARIFLMTMPEGNEKAKLHSELLYKFAEIYEFTYIIDLAKYAPPYDAEFKKKYYLGGHMNPMGYMLTAKYVMSYIDYIIRHNLEDFKQVSFIGLQYHSAEAKW